MRIVYTVCMTTLKTITANDSSLTDWQVRQYAAAAKAWICEHYWEYDEDVFETFVPSLENDLGLMLKVAESIDAICDVYQRDADCFEEAVEQGIALCLQER